ncbi:DUF2214 domain-containing protein [Marivibrio halodurans]|uniref:DUF2214 domain-containing protein n=1 Tax=Marivibrio halodurans TaxID=2039722 RepID=A0A8J7V241_9PROT|nr:DUF2214 domain-containing protein [Marivibrio halodurans]MBP5856980.1 DUF2214 domain-containing protein [Marivibrio halodurans]
MEALLAALEGNALAQGLRFSRWGYAAVNTAHVLGIALLVGAILPLDLRLMGLWRRVPLAPLARVLRPTAAVGLLIAAASGALLFATRASEYAALPLLQVKVLLILSGASAALLLHRAAGADLAGAGAGRLRLHGALSLTCWLGALVCGRLLAFVGE